MQSGSYHAAHPDYFSQFCGDVVLITCVILGYRRPDADWRRREVLPDEHLGTAFARVQTQELAVCWADSLEEVENSQGVQILHGLAKMLINFGVVGLRLGEGFLELNLFFRGDFLG